jgi:hypothetical protein
MKEKGLHLCYERNSTTKRFCHGVYLFEDGLKAHIEKAKATRKARLTSRDQCKDAFASYSEQAWRVPCHRKQATSDEQGFSGRYQQVNVGI